MSEKVTTGFSNPGFATENREDSRLEQDQSSSPGTPRAGSGEGCNLKLSDLDNQDDNHVQDYFRLDLFFFL